jgi:hypothetical protein
MGESAQRRVERYHRAYQRGAVVCLLMAMVAGGYLLAVALGAVGGRWVSGGATGVVALFVAALLAVSLATLRGRLWRRGDPAARLVLRDEWTRRNWSRASTTGFAVVMWAQVPLALLLGRYAPGASLVGMAGLSMALGMGAFWATYLYLGRQQGDG